MAYAPPALPATLASIEAVESGFAGGRRRCDGRQKRDDSRGLGPLTGHECRRCGGEHSEDGGDPHLACKVPGGKDAVLSAEGNQSC